MALGMVHRYHPVFCVLMEHSPERSVCTGNIVFLLLSEPVLLSYQHVENLPCVCQGYCCLPLPLILGQAAWTSHL